MIFYILLKNGPLRFLLAGGNVVRHACPRKGCTNHKRAALSLCRPAADALILIIRIREPPHDVRALKRQRR